MLAQLSTVKTRLGLSQFDVANDALLASLIQAVSVRFDKECNRTFARTENATHEFAADQTEIPVPCYPIETVARFELKASEADGWLEQTNVQFLIRQACVISLAAPLSYQVSTIHEQLAQARLTYTGGYVLPGATPGAGQTPLPADVEQAAVEQVAYWFQNRGQHGLKTIWTYHGTYQQFAQEDLLLSVRAVLWRYQRWVL